MKKIVWLVGCLVVGIMAFAFSVVHGLTADPGKKPAPEIKVNVTGFIQTQFEHYDNADDTFKVLRARPKIKADMGEYVDLFVQLDVIPDNILRDAWIQLDYSEYAKFRMGQFPLPFGWQTSLSPYNVLTNTYSNVISKLYGADDSRDTGVMLLGDFKKFNYVAACVNGEGANTTDKNDPKAFVGRVGFKPVDGLDLGVSGYSGKRGLAEYDRTRCGADLRYNKENLIVQGEYIRSNDDTVASAIEPNTVAGKGYFVEVGYKVTAKIQPVFRFDVWDPEVSGTYGSLTKYALGLNWYSNDWVRLQGIYEFREEEKNKINDNAFITQMGLSF